MSTTLSRQASTKHAAEISELGYSVMPFQLAVELGSRFSQDTSRVTSALLSAMQESLTSLLTEVFNGLPPRIDPSAMKKLSNSLLSAGISGIERTEKALTEIQQMNSVDGKRPLNISELAEQLRSDTTNFRKASTYMDHQARCIKAFLNLFQEDFEKIEGKFPSMVLPVRSRKDFDHWASELVEYWFRNTRVDSKNQAMYVNVWRVFIQETVDSKEKNGYAATLLKNVKGYLHPAEFENFERAYVRLQDRVPQATKVSSAPKTTYKRDSGLASICTTFKLSADQVLEIKNDLFFIFANDKLLKMEDLELFIPEEEPDTLIIRFHPPSEMIAYRRMIESLNRHIQEAYTQLR